jgi:hypothetical protein
LLNISPKACLAAAVSAPSSVNSQLSEHPTPQPVSRRNRMNF